MKNESFKEARLINDIVSSIISKDVEDKYLQMYLSDLELRKKCDTVISEYVEEGLDAHYCLNYLNNVVKPQLKEKPYLLNINAITMAIEETLDKISSKYHKEESLIDEEILNRPFYNARDLLNKIDNDFVLKNIDTDAEERFAISYINKIKNNEPLSKEQVEELVSFTVMGGFLLNHEEYTDKAFDYALKNILNNNYKINKYLYKKVFIHSCNKILEERDITDISINFREQNNLMSYSNKSRSIFINHEEFANREPIMNFMLFFHELRHYEQYNGLIKDPLKRFLCCKDIFLSDELPYKEYYKKNYNNLFIEKDACYTSYKYVYDYIKEKAPSKLPHLKKQIYKDLFLTINMEEKSITERKYNESVKDINILFDELIKEKKNAAGRYGFLKFCNSFVDTPLLIEYDIFGNKRSIFELLASKDYNQKQGNKDRVAINNYLLYEESVSIDYIISNMKLFDSDRNKELFGAYYKEARKVLKHKLIRYASDTLSDKKNKLGDDKTMTSLFYELVIDKLRKKNIRMFKKNKDMELYREREEELRIAYKWLYDLSKEIEEEAQEKSKNKKR